MPVCSRSLWEETVSLREMTRMAHNVVEWFIFPISMNVSFAKVTPLNMSLHHANTTSKPLMLWEVARMGQCENAHDRLRQGGREMGERGRGQEVRTGRQIDDEGGRKFKRERQRKPKNERARESWRGGGPQRKGGYKGTQYSWVKPSLLWAMVAVTGHYLSHPLS